MTTPGQDLAVWSPMNPTQYTETTEHLQMNEPEQGWGVNDINAALTMVGNDAAPMLLSELSVLLTIESNGSHYEALVARFGPCLSTRLAICLGKNGCGYWKAIPAPRQTGTAGAGHALESHRLSTAGAPESHRRGWSWTSDRDVASRFSDGKHYHRQPGNVWKTTATPAMLLARIDGRQEAEYVIDPNTLGEVEFA